jgi:hypothetical protein
MSKARKALIIFGVSLILSIGVLIMTQICKYNQENISNEEWLEKSNQLCKTFFDFNQIIRNFLYILQISPP